MRARGARRAARARGAPPAARARTRQLEPVDAARWPRFVLSAEGEAPVVYVNAMESPVSCMETEIIAAKNAALLLAEAGLFRPDRGARARAPSGARRGAPAAAARDLNAL